MRHNAATVSGQIEHRDSTSVDRMMTLLDLGLAETLPETSVSPLGLTAGSSVQTLDGALPVQYLAPGDRILTRAGSRILRKIAVTIRRNAEMIRISASALGHDRPEADLFVTPEQPIFLRDWRARALYGRDQVMVAAARLVDGSYIRPERVAEVRIFSLHFDSEEVFYASGLELVSSTLEPALPRG